MPQIACHAVHGDGSVNLYEGPVGPKTEAAIAAINEWEPGMMEYPATDESLEEAAETDCDTPGVCETDEELAETLLWWANGCEDDRDLWEVDVR